MRTDEHGQACPETLGEYRDMCAAISGESAATHFLDKKITEHPDGRAEKCLPHDSQMRVVLMPLMLKPVPAPEVDPSKLQALKDAFAGTPNYEGVASSLWFAVRDYLGES